MATEMTGGGPDAEAEGSLLLLDQSSRDRRASHLWRPCGYPGTIVNGVRVVLVRCPALLLAVIVAM